MLRIGICDDSAEARLALRAAVSRLLTPRGVEHTVFEFSSGEGLTGWMQKHAGELDLVFLDIEMGGMDGMETAKALRAADDGLLIVFVTGYSDFVFDGYSVGALGYLMKPPQDAQLDETLSRALGALYRDADKAFLCRNSEGLYRIPKKTIRYFYSDRRLVTCVTDTREYTFYARLDDVAEDVGAAFVRIHQRYLVRAGAVDRIEGGEVHIAGQTLPVSRKYQSEALIALSRAMLE
ncbi:LytR/AlgR family response regulator transcription factor [Agathobaculum sp.]|uniref:LytR/AlgR family response regulator transcription factor n=1 Tax=Agathobaculum sp. TaxID=2048138 RepID=UPI002A7ECB12|nr:LytTR family DNA-binding domain-containing protein [Agathobaculum sp.]MDY3618738.1 LytTR family DNA-binding domain-containing protein [Agathobaculum sp.]